MPYQLSRDILKSTNKQGNSEVEVERDNLRLPTSMLHKHCETFDTKENTQAAQYNVFQSHASFVIYVFVSFISTALSPRLQVGAILPTLLSSYINAPTTNQNPPCRTLWTCSR